MVSIITFISVKTVWSVNPTTPKKSEVVYSYKSPDGTLWTHRDRNALERLKEHYSLNSPEVFNRIEAERQPIENTFMESAVTLPYPRFGNPVWSDWIEAIVIGACTIVIGSVSLYALRSPKRVYESGVKSQESRLTTPDSGLKNGFKP